MPSKHGGFFISPLHNFHPPPCTIPSIASLSFHPIIIIN